MTSKNILKRAYQTEGITSRGSVATCCFYYGRTIRQLVLCLQGLSQGKQQLNGNIKIQLNLHCIFTFRVGLEDYNSRKVRDQPQAVCCDQQIAVTCPWKHLKQLNLCIERKKKLKWTQWRCKTYSKYLCHTENQDSNCFIKYHKK